MQLAPGVREIRQVEPETGQMDLGIIPIKNNVTGDTTQERFLSFHELNPWIYATLVRMCEQLVAKGRTRIGMKMLFEVLRWQYARSTVGDDLKLNNNYTSYYTRLIADNRPDLAILFEMRRMRA